MRGSWRAAALALSLAAWAGAAPAPPPAPAAPPPDAPGSLAGTVRYAGSAPLRIKELTNTVDVETCGAKVRSDQVLAGPKGALANVVVELRLPEGGILEDAALQGSKVPVVVELLACGHQPHVQLVPLGSAVEIVNSDRLGHRLETWTSRNAALDLELERFRRRVVVPASSLLAAERVRVTCATHPWMVGWWIVTDNARTVVTRADGRFALTTIPPGDYVLTAWHEQLGSLARDVTVRPGEALALDLELR